MLEYWISETSYTAPAHEPGSQRSMTPSLQHSSWCDSTIHSKFVLKQNAEQLSHQFLKRHHRERQRYNRRKSRSHEPKQAVSCNRRDVHCSHHFETIGQIRQRLDVGAADQSLACGRSTTEPFGIELAHITVGKRAIFAIAGPLRLSELRCEHQQRTQDQAHQKDD